MADRAETVDTGALYEQLRQRFAGLVCELEPATQARAAALEDELNHVRSAFGGPRTGPGPGGAGAVNTSPGGSSPGGSSPSEATVRVPDANFGARVEKILRMAEEEAREVRTQANAEASALV